jgi:hypothetical protein
MSEALEASNVAPFPAGRRRRSRANGAHPPKPDWANNLLLDDKGRPFANLANTMVALRSVPDIAEIFAYDEMLGAAILVQRLPETKDDEPTPRAVRDVDVSALQEYLQRIGLPRIGRETVHQAVDLRAREHAFHPVRDYLRDVQ